MFYGPSYWRFIHYFSLYDVGRTELFPLVPNFLPEEFQGEWENPGENETLKDWSIRLHNKVNAKLGKWDKWDETDFNIAHKPECDFKENKEFIFMFPWALLHHVANTEHPTALAFLKTFNELYPDEQTRNTFFTDDPQEGETVYDWTLRHHKRMNVENNRPEMTYIPVPPPENGVAGSTEATTAALAAATIQQQ
jgi:hypothetical protein